MSKITLKVEIEEKDYKALIGQEVFNIWQGNTILSTVFNAIKTAKPIEECDDAVSIQVVNEILLKYAHSEEGKLFTEFLISQIKDLPSVTPKREQGEWIYTPEKHIVDETNDEVVYATENRCSCSACGHKYGFCKMNDAYCRYCGAEMKGVGE